MADMHKPKSAAEILASHQRMRRRAAQMLADKISNPNVKGGIDGTNRSYMNMDPATGYSKLGKKPKKPASIIGGRG